MHVVLKFGVVEYQLPLPGRRGRDGNFQPFRGLNGSYHEVLIPGCGQDALGLPKAIHNGGPGEISVTVPALDDAVGFLIVPHDFNFTVDPFFE